jgi:DNA-binding NtrC family response regulator
MAHELADKELRCLFERYGFIARSDTMLPLLRQAKKAAHVSDITILVEGETGTGKQVLAEAIHRLDEKRKSFPFVTVHCSTISEALAESELFGHQRGAFSGATRNREGLFHAAHRGTLFLDDVSDLPLTLQPKLLDVIQRGIVRGVGSDREVPVNVRIIAATNQPLAPLVQQNRFRVDLYHRLNVVQLHVPPLRDRPADLAALVLAFARRHQHIYPHVTEVEPDLIRALRSQPFPGNIRELEHAVERMLFGKTEGHSLGLSDWMLQSGAGTSTGDDHDPLVGAAQCVWSAIFQHGLPFGVAFRRLERKVLETALLVEGQTRRDIARRLSTSERTLYHKLRTYRLSRPSVAR